MHFELGSLAVDPNIIHMEMVYLEVFSPNHWCVWKKVGLGWARGEARLWCQAKSHRGWLLLSPGREFCGQGRSELQSCTLQGLREPGYWCSCIHQLETVPRHFASWTEQPSGLLLPQGIPPVQCSARRIEMLLGAQIPRGRYFEMANFPQGHGWGILPHATRTAESHYVMVYKRSLHMLEEALIHHLCLWWTRSKGKVQSGLASHWLSPWYLKFPSWIGLPGKEMQDLVFLGNRAPDACAFSFSLEPGEDTFSKQVCPGESDGTHWRARHPKTRLSWGLHHARSLDNSQSFGPHTSSMWQLAPLVPILYMEPLRLTEVVQLPRDLRATQSQNRNSGSDLLDFASPFCPSINLRDLGAWRESLTLLIGKRLQRYCSTWRMYSGISRCCPRTLSSCQAWKQMKLRGKDSLFCPLN